jgi:hypothetical protein
MRVRRGSLESKKDPDGRLQVRAYDDLSGTEPRPEGESAALVSDRTVTSRLPGEREGPLVKEIVRGRMKPTYRVQQHAWLLLRAAIRDRTKGRDEPVVALRHPDVARRVGFESGSPGLVRQAFPRATGLRQAGYGRHQARRVRRYGLGHGVAGARPLGSLLVAEGVRVMGVADYLAWSLFAALGATGSAQLFMAAERHGAVAQAWLAAMAFFLWSALAALCFRRAI